MDDLFAQAFADAMGGGSSEPRPYYAKGTPNLQTWVGPRNRWTNYEMRGQTKTVDGPGRKTFAEHEQWFVDKWAADAKFRVRLTQLAVAAGFANENTTADEYLNIWLKAGETSSRWADQGNNKTPWEVLAFFAGANGGSDPTGASRTRTSRSVSYDITDPKTAKALTNQVLSAALGRKATDDEVASYLSALNAAERANPRTTVTTTDAEGNSTSTSSGGVPNAEAIIEDKASNTVEGQAYQTNNVFNDAMRFLAGG